MLKLILKDNTEIELQEAGLPQHYVVVCDSITTFRGYADAMTPENLSEIRISDGHNILQTIVNSRLSGTQTVNNPGGTITGHFYLADGAIVQNDADYAEAGHILLGEEGWL